MNGKSVIAGTLVVAGLLVMPLQSRGAEDGAALFKAKCSACHGPNGEGKPAMKAPALKGTSLTVDQLVDFITKGDAAKKAPHQKAIAGVNADQAKAIAEHIKTLK